VDNKKIIFVNGQCLNCDTPITTGILCHKCTPPATFKLSQSNDSKSTNIVHRDLRISNMESGEVAYVAEYAIFELESKLYIIGSAMVSLQSEKYQTVRVKRCNKYFEVDVRTILPDDIWLGWPQSIEEDDYYPAKLV